MAKKKMGLVCVGAVCLLLLTACRKQEPVNGTEPVGDVQAETQPPSPVQEGEPRILIAYFTMHDNTVQVDSVTTASPEAPGDTIRIAQYIQAEIGGQLHSIQVKELYSSDHDENLQRTTEELETGARPAITTEVENMKEYDVVFIGYPDWWMSLPTPVATFLESYDFSKKTVIPFCTHGGSGFGKSVQELQELCPGATVLEGFETHRNNIGSSQGAVTDWVGKLGLTS